MVHLRHRTLRAWVPPRSPNTTAAQGETSHATVHEDRGSRPVERSQDRLQPPQPERTATPSAAAAAAAAADNTPRPLDVLRAYADHPSAFLAVNSNTQHYFGNKSSGLVAYLPGNSHHIQFAGPIAAPENRGRLLDEYMETLSVGRHRGFVTAVQLRPPDIGLYANRGFVINQLGISHSIDLARFTLRGGALAKVRQNVSRARREGVTVVETHGQNFLDGPNRQRIDEEWLRSKGRHVKKLSFMVGEHGGTGQPLRRTFLARRRGAAIAYITYVPAWGQLPGWLCDLSRRSPQAPVGTHELINLTALTRFKEERAGWLHLGLSPFAGLSEEHQLSCASTSLKYAIRQVGERGRFLYPAKTQNAFKLKWDPHVSVPEYVAFQDRLRWPAVWRLLRKTHVL